MYRHRWAYQPNHPGYAHAWPTILADSRRIIEAVRRAGIVVAGPDGYRRPVLDGREGLDLNGDATSDLAGEAFQLLAPLPVLPQGRPTVTAFCTTGARPYDLAVSTILLRCALLIPHAFAVASDGSWDREWVHGATLGGTAPRLGARAVIADLFGVRPRANPLRATVTDIRFGTDPAVANLRRDPGTPDG
jgi:hypothetical protein